MLTKMQPDTESSTNFFFVCVCDVCDEFDQILSFFHRFFGFNSSWFSVMRLIHSNLKAYPQCTQTVVAVKYPHYQEYIVQQHREEEFQKPEINLIK